MTQTIWTAADAGCYADGASGHDHVRSTLAGLLRGLGHEERAAELEGKPLDDYGDEEDALDLLDAACDDHCRWVLEDGDLHLMRRMHCDQCETLAINRIPTHETGCPNGWLDPMTGQPSKRECSWCGCDFCPEERHQTLCSEACAEDYLA